MRRIIVVGDIHGCYDELCDLLEKIGLRSDDCFVSVGDLIVKGEKNREVLELFMSDARLSAVLGNHDRKLLRHWKGETVQLKKVHEDALSELESDKERYARYLDSLPLMIDLGAHLIVHAGVRPGVSLEEQSVEDLTELRTLGRDRTEREGMPWYEEYSGEKTVLFGHWPALEPRRAPRAIGLDTGCVYGHQLTAYLVETDEFISVPARRTYQVPKASLK